MAEDSNPPETCTEAACVDAQTDEPRSILGEVSEDAFPDHVDAVVAEEPKALSARQKQKPPVNHSAPVPAHGPKQHVHHQQQQLTSIQHLMTTGSGISSSLLVLSLVAFLVWHYYKHGKQQKEWRRSSNTQLEMVRKRNLQLAEELESSATKPECVQGNMRTGKKKKGKDVENKVDSDDNARKEICPVKTTPPTTKYAINNSLNSSNHLSKIRAEQQDQLVTKTKSTQQQRHRQQTRRKQILHNSLNHAAADDAHERRRSSIMAEEESLLRSQMERRALQRQHDLEDQEQQALDDLNEMERRALQQQQDLEYQESLQRDEELARQLALVNERRYRREKAIEEAKQRLANAGVQSNDISIESNKMSEAQGGASEIKVRLLLPSGRRVGGTFAVHHAMGLVYDLALIALDEGNLLWCQKDEGEGDGMNIIDNRSDDDDSCDSSVNDGNGYNGIYEEWKQIFYSFSIVSTFPQRTFEQLSSTLEDCGLSHNAMIMVVVDSD